MAIRTDTFDIGALRLLPGEGRKLELGLAIEPLELGGHTYTVTRPADVSAEEAAAGAPAGVPAELLDATLGLSRMTGQGYALHLTFAADLHGPCMRCLEPADPQFQVDAREISQPDLEDPDEGVEVISPYVTEQVLNVGAWARDALALALPAALLCKPDCLGLCPACGTDLNTAGPEHVHEPEPDLRWAVLSELKFDGVDAPDSAGPADAPADAADGHGASGVSAVADSAVEAAPSQD